MDFKINLSPRVAQAQRDDLAEQLTEAMTKAVAEKQQSDRAVREAAEEAAKQQLFLRHKIGDLLTNENARRAVRLSKGKTAERLTWKRHGADFARAVVRRAGHHLKDRFGVERHEWPADEVICIKAALAESSGVTGGYVVPQGIARTILYPFLQRSVFRSNGALQLVTRNRSVYVPTPDVTTAPAAGVPPWAGGLNFVWAAEAKTRTETEPKFKLLELCKNELSGSITLSAALLQDGASVALQEVLAGLIGQAVAWLEDFNWFQGSGVGQPQGIFTAPATIQQSRQTGGTVTYLDVATMLAKLTVGSLGNAVWAFNPTALPKLLQLTDGSNRAVFFSTGNTRQGERPQWSLAGLPALPTDALPALGTKGDLCLIDPRYYAIHDHGDSPGGTVEMIASEQVNFLTNQVVIRVVRRTDGQPLIEKPITLGDGATQVSPFIVLN